MLGPVRGPTVEYRDTETIPRSGWGKAGGTRLSVVEQQYWGDSMKNGVWQLSVIVAACAVATVTFAQQTAQIDFDSVGRAWPLEDDVNAGQGGGRGGFGGFGGFGRRGGGPPQPSGPPEGVVPLERERR